MNTWNLNAKVGTKKIRLDASGCPRDQKRYAGPPWQEVVPLRRTGQAAVQAVAKDADDAGIVCLAQVKSPKNPGTTRAMIITAVIPVQLTRWPRPRQECQTRPARS